MIQKTVSDWLQEWDSADTDVSNVLRCLEEYINPGILTFLRSAVGYTSNNARITDVKNAYSNFIMLPLDSRRRIHNPQIIEYILACIKQEINNYPDYHFVFAGYPHDSNRITVPENDVFLIDKFILSSWNDASIKAGFQYKVITPKNIIVEDTIELIALDESLSNNSCSLKSLFPYTKKILELTSSRGHTRGSYIQETDDLFSLLKAIKNKTAVDYFNLDYMDILDRHAKFGLFGDMDTSSSWQKQGDFRKTLDNPRINHLVCYANVAKSNISVIELSCYQNGTMELK